MVSLLLFALGYIAQVWHLSALTGVRVGGIPLGELLFGLSFGMYGTSVCEHFSWHRTVPRAHARGARLVS